MAKTHVLSGNVSTPVRVIATIEVDDENGNTLTLSTVSDLLVVSTGLPDQNSISLSSQFLNVAGAMNLDGLTSEIMVRMADKFNNPVPDGTAALFTTEYGVIGNSCTTVAGACTVTWTSQSPKGSGRSTILVVAIGEEFFVDANGNGTYDEFEVFVNLPEAFVDHNENGSYTPNSTETFVDFNRNGIYDLNNQPAWYNGILCPQEGAGIWCSRDLLNVRDQLVLVLSFEEMNIVLVNSNGSVVSGTIEGPTYRALISDDNGNPPAGGRSVTVSVSGDCVLLSGSSFQIPDTNAPGPFEVIIRTAGEGGVNGEAGSNGSVQVTVTNGRIPSTADFVCASTPPDPNDGGLIPGG